MEKHIYRIKQVGNPATVKRVGHDNYEKARTLAQGWAASLTASTGEPHVAVKVRNAYGSGRRGAAEAPRVTARAAPAVGLLATLEAWVRAAASKPGAPSYVSATENDVTVGVYTARPTHLVYYVGGRRAAKYKAATAIVRKLL